MIDELLNNEFFQNSLVQHIAITLIIILIIPLIGMLIEGLNVLFIRIISKLTNRKVALFFANRLTFLGTVHHELSHALFAFLTGGKIVEISLFKPEGDTLGKVAFQPRGNRIMQGIQMTMTAIAPVIMGSLNLTLMIIFVLPLCSAIWHYILLFFLMISIFLHTTMSSQDVKNALSGLPICALIIFALTYVAEWILIR